MSPRDALVLVGTALVSGGLTSVVRGWAIRRGWSVTIPRDRDVHTHPIPRLGGFGVVLAFVIVTILFAQFVPSSLGFVQERWLGVDANLMGILLGALLLLGVGVYDDIKGLSPWLKLGSHVLAGVILAWSGVLIHHISNPFGEAWLLGAWAGLFVVIWTVFVINAVNWIDGLDGLASGIGLIAAIILYFLAVQTEVNQLSMSILAIILAGALLGFLPFNFYPAKIFLGDSGSQVLGFLLAAFAIISGGKLATAMLILGVPLLDTVWVIIRRLASKQAIYKADKLHIHHRLLTVGLSQKQAVVALYAVASVFGLIALNTQTLGKLVAGLLLVGMMIATGALLVWLPKRRVIDKKEKNG